MAKAALVSQIDDIIRQRGITQAEAARRMGIDQPRVSALLRGKLDLFSLEKLMVLVSNLGNDVEIRVHPASDPGIRVVPIPSPKVMTAGIANYSLAHSTLPCGFSSGSTPMGPVLSFALAGAKEVLIDELAIPGATISKPKDDQEEFPYGA
jgi:predicted XRE-type DNA-binding protein